MFSDTIIMQQAGDVANPLMNHSSLSAQYQVALKLPEQIVWTGFKRYYLRLLILPLFTRRCAINVYRRS